MPRSLMSVNKVAASLHVSPREVVRMAEQRILPGQRIKGAWQFRAAEVWNWIEENLQTLSERGRIAPHTETTHYLLIAPALREKAVAVDLVAKTKSSVIREIARLAEAADPYVDGHNLASLLLDREARGSTALQDGVAVPHPAEPIYSEGVVLAAARTCQGVVFGERRGGLSDLFFLVCCRDHTEHLLYLGRLCRLLINKELLDALRYAQDATAFVDEIHRAEAGLCRSR